MGVSPIESLPFLNIPPLSTEPWLLGESIKITPPKLNFIEPENDGLLQISESPFQTEADFFRCSHRIYMYEFGIFTYTYYQQSSWQNVSKNAR